MKIQPCSLALVRALALLAGLAAASFSHAADVIIDWNRVAREAVRTDVSNPLGTTQPGPTFASRNLAMVHGAMFDAVNSVGRNYQPFRISVPTAAGTSSEAAAAQAAYEVLKSLYPAQTPTFDDALATSLNAIPNDPSKTAGITLGSTVAADMILWRRTDHAYDPPTYMPSNNVPGRWEADPLHPGQTPLTSNWGRVTPFTMATGDQFRPAAPPAMDSAAYTAAYNEVKELGAINSATRTADQTQIGAFWGYDRAGMGPPPILYSQVAETIALQEGNTMEQNARLFALLNIAQADGGIVSWDCKYAYDLWRPVTAIREADTDGNPATVADPSWTPLGTPGPDPFTPPFPAYTSGHATFGSALFRTLERFYGTDNMNYTLASDELPGVTRSYTSFSQANAENARSRIYLGIHWNFDDTIGRETGALVADYIFDHHMQPVPEPSTVALTLLTLVPVAVRLAKRRREVRG